MLLLVYIIVVREGGGKKGEFDVQDTNIFHPRFVIVFVSQAE